MTYYLTMSWIGGGLALALAVAALVVRRPSLVRWLFAAGMILLGLEAVLIGQSIAALTPDRIVFWQNLRLAVLTLVPGTWLLFSLTYSRGNYREFLRRWRWTWILLFLVPLALGIWERFHFIDRIREGAAPYQWYLELTLPGRLLMALSLAGSILVLMNLERTFRASVGTMRWRIKFMVLGLAMLFAVIFFTSSQSLLYGNINLLITGLNVIALILAIGIMAVAVWRVGLHTQDVYPSQSLVNYSVTGLLAGAYLLIVGLLAKLVTLWGGDAAFPLKAFIVLVALVGLSVLLLSDRLRQRGRRFLSRHLRRPYYDYRQAWSTFTERTSSAANQEAFSREVVKWISDTLHILSINMWVFEDDRQQFVLAASSSIEDGADTTRMNVDEGAEQFIQALRQKPLPVRLESSSEPWLRSLEQFNPRFFPSGKERVCVPLVAGDQFLGLITLADRVGNQTFTEEDMDLLKTVADPIAATLLNFKLSQRLLQLREMEAFQVMSAFFVHDLKNTASTLNLMLKNMPNHFDDPEFRADALRGLDKSVTRINELIGRLGMIREALKLNRKPAQLTRIVQQSVQALQLPAGVQLKLDLGDLPEIPIDADQIGKVISNLLHNAIDAMPPNGILRVETSRRGDWAVASVTDTGCGMSPDYIAHSLFRPFQTTKNKGIGIGLFLSRQIVAAHQGKIEVQSELGKGTTFQIWLPVETP